MSRPVPDDRPWYRQFWPWLIIAIPASAVIASMIVVWLAVTRPDALVVEPLEYQQLRSDLRAGAGQPGPGEDDG